MLTTSQMATKSKVNIETGASFSYYIVPLLSLNGGYHGKPDTETTSQNR